MQAMLAGFAAIIVIAIGADMVLDEVGFAASERFTGEAVRLGPTQ